MSKRRRDLDRTLEHDAISDDGSQGRLERLGSAVARIRGGRRMDPDRATLIGGALLIVLGLVLIVVGWYGAANTGLQFEQTPYLISGGILGLALCFIGGFVYFAYWITRLVRESRTQTQRMAELLEQISESLDGGGFALGRVGGRRPAIAGAGTEFVATKGGTFFHRPDCPVVEGRKTVRKVTAKASGLEPCRICDPLSTSD